jgi:hypothetical protein
MQIQRTIALTRPSQINSVERDVSTQTIGKVLAENLQKRATDPFQTAVCRAI